VSISLFNHPIEYKNDSLTEAFEDSNPLVPILFSLEREHNGIWIQAIKKAVPGDGLFLTLG
jgi:hypothetical protein